MECSYNEWIFIRLGESSIFKADSNISCSSFGMGLKFWDTELSFAALKDPVTEGQISFLSIVYSPPKFEIIQVAEARPEKGKPAELLSITFPDDNYETYDETISIEGQTNPQASVSINGINVFIESDGKFKAIQSLMPGKNLIEIVGSLGREKRIISRKVLRRAKVVIAEEEGLNRKIVDEVLNKEAEIIKKEEQIKKEKQKGIDVSAKEKMLASERETYASRKDELYNEKRKLEERKEKVENLVTLGVIEVSKEKSFEIESKITRGEMISWLVKAMGLTIPKIKKSVFADVPERHIYAPYIKAAFDAGLIKRPADGMFRPDDPVTEDEGEMFFKAFGVIK